MGWQDDPPATNVAPWDLDPSVDETVNNRKALVKGIMSAWAPGEYIDLAKVLFGGKPTAPEDRTLIPGTNIPLFPRTDNYQSAIKNLTGYDTDTGPPPDDATAARWAAIQGAGGVLGPGMLRGGVTALTKGSGLSKLWELVSGAGVGEIQNIISKIPDQTLQQWGIDPSQRDQIAGWLGLGAGSTANALSFKTPKDVQVAKDVTKSTTPEQLATASADMQRFNDAINADQTGAGFSLGQTLPPGTAPRLNALEQEIMQSPSGSSMWDARQKQAAALANIIRGDPAGGSSFIDKLFPTTAGSGGAVVTGTITPPLAQRIKTAWNSASQDKLSQQGGQISPFGGEQMMMDLLGEPGTPKRQAALDAVEQAMTQFYNKSPFQAPVDVPGAINDAKTGLNNLADAAIASARGRNTVNFSPLADKIGMGSSPVTMVAHPAPGFRVGLNAMSQVITNLLYKHSYDNLASILTSPDGFVKLQELANYDPKMNFAQLMSQLAGSTAASNPGTGGGN